MMKKILSTILLGMGMLSFSACATKPEGLSTMPVVAQGNPSDISLTKRITLVKAGTSIPVNASVTGDVFTKDINKTIYTVLKDDTYFYSTFSDSDARLWISYDLQHWVTLQDAFGGGVDLDYTISPNETTIRLGFEANTKIDK